jgi:hypothetical protein
LADWVSFSPFLKNILDDPDKDKRMLVFASVLENYQKEIKLDDYILSHRDIRAYGRLALQPEVIDLCSGGIWYLGHSEVVPVPGDVNTVLRFGGTGRGRHWRRIGAIMKRQ